MTSLIPPPPARTVRRALTTGLPASSLSTVALLWRGHTDAGSAVAPVNAIARWFWPQDAMRSDRPSIRYTATGSAVHFASSLLWGGVYGWLRERLRRPNKLNAVADAAAVSSVAALVDLKLLPKRLIPGFGERLRPTSLVIVYTSFAAGLALGGMNALRR